MGLALKVKSFDILSSSWRLEDAEYEIFDDAEFIEDEGKCYRYPYPRHGFCKDFFKGKLLQGPRANRQDEEKFENYFKNLYNRQLPLVLDAIKIGKDDIGLMKILLTNYMEMNNHKKVPFPNDKNFRQMIHSLLKPSLKVCLNQLKLITCNHYFPTCKQPKIDCRKLCEKIRRDECKDQTPIMDYLHSTGLFKAKFSCEGIAHHCTRGRSFKWFYGK